MIARIARVVAAAAALLALSAHPATSSEPQEGRTVPSDRTAASCSRPAPTTAAGYAQLWDSLDERVWGGGDVSVSTLLPDGRRVWLYGDTFSSGRFAHSTAIVQNRGCLHVSRGGAQVLPDGPTANGRKTVRWVEAVRVAPDGSLRITAEEHSVGPSGVWDIRYEGTTKVARATVTLAGDVVFDRWVSSARVPAADPGQLIPFAPGHFGYSVRQHGITLSDGQPLTTMAQNYDDGVLRSPRAYAPLWCSGTKAQVTADPQGRCVGLGS